MPKASGCMMRFTVAGLFLAIRPSLGLGQGTAADAAVKEWAAGFANIQSGEITWDMDRPTVRMDRKHVDSFRVDQFVRFRWPDAMDIQTSRGRGSTDAPFPRSAPFNARTVLFRHESMEFSGQGSRKWVRRSDSTFDWTTSRAVFMEGAPLLAGKWLNDIGFPQGRVAVSRGAGETYQITVAEMQIRLELSSHSGPGRSALVLSKVESLTQSGAVGTTFEFSNFAVPDGLETAIGFRRRVVLAPSTLEGMDDMPAIPLEREDFITEAKVVPRFEDSEFIVSTAGFQDVTKPKQQLPQVAQPQPPEATVSKGDRKGAAFDIVPNWLPGTGIGLIIASALLFVRSRCRTT